MIEFLPDVWLDPLVVYGWRLDPSNMSDRAGIVVTLYAVPVQHTHTFGSRREADMWMDAVRVQLEAEE